MVWHINKEKFSPEKKLDLLVALKQASLNENLKTTLEYIIKSEKTIISVTELWKNCVRNLGCSNTWIRKVFLVFLKRFDCVDFDTDNQQLTIHDLQPIIAKTQIVRVPDTSRLDSTRNYLNEIPYYTQIETIFHQFIPSAFRVSDSDPRQTLESKIKFHYIDKMQEITIRTKSTASKMATISDINTMLSLDAMYLLSLNNHYFNAGTYTLDKAQTQELLNKLFRVDLYAVCKHLKINTSQSDRVLEAIRRLRYTSIFIDCTKASSFFSNIGLGDRDNADFNYLSELYEVTHESEKVRYVDIKFNTLKLHSLLSSSINARFSIESNFFAKYKGFEIVLILFFRSKINSFTENYKIWLLNEVHVSMSPNFKDYRSFEKKFINTLKKYVIGTWNESGNNCAIIEELKIEIDFNKENIAAVVKDHALKRKIRIPKVPHPIIKASKVGVGITQAWHYNQLDGRKIYNTQHGDENRLERIKRAMFYAGVSQDTVASIFTDAKNGIYDINPEPKEILEIALKYDSYVKALLGKAKLMYGGKWSIETELQKIKYTGANLFDVIAKVEAESLKSKFQE